LDCDDSPTKCSGAGCAWDNGRCVDTPSGIRQLGSDLPIQFEIEPGDSTSAVQIRAKLASTTASAITKSIQAAGATGVTAGSIKADTNPPTTAPTKAPTKLPTKAPTAGPCDTPGCNFSDGEKAGVAIVVIFGGLVIIFLLTRELCGAKTTEEKKQPPVRAGDVEGKLTRK